MSTLFERFSSRDNLKRAYKYVQNELAHSTLSVNPINHPALTAINALGEQFFVALEQYLRDGKYVPERGFFVYIPKDNLGLRPVCVLSMIDRIVYQAMFNQNIFGYKIDGQLSDKVCFANRVNDDEDADNFLSLYFNGWDEFCKAQKKAFERGFAWKSEVDVQQYYEHIPVGSLVAKLENEFGIKDEKLLDLLKSQLCTWAEYFELPKGIPQGPAASAVLANAYLSSLDKFAEAGLIGKGLRYMRYADDIILMGKSREDVLKATEKIVRFLRNHNLNLNEKTQLTELQDAESIEALRIASDYEDNDSEIPEDEFTRIQEKVPSIVQAIADGERVEKLELRELKYYLGRGTRHDLGFLHALIGIIPLRPSLVIPIIKYVADGRGVLRIFGDPFEVFLIDSALWDTYSNKEISEWSKFWILKLLVSSEDVLVNGVEIEEEMTRILASRDATIFKVVGLYFQAIRGNKIEMEVVKQALAESETEVEKSLYSFFLLNAFDGARAPAVRDCVEKAVNAPSQEMNLIGCYLFQNRAKIAIDDIEGPFSQYILKRKKPEQGKPPQKANSAKERKYYVVPEDALIPFASPANIFGMNRTARKRHSIEINLPEITQWEKVEMKMKEGLRDVEIFYDGTFIQSGDYAQLGFFSGKKQQKPDRQWGFLCALSVLAATDITQATADKMRNMVAVNSKLSLTTGNVHQIKRTLVKRLRALFKTDEDPFYDRRDYYHPKFTILPEPDLRQAKIWKQGGKLNENRTYEDTDTDE